MICDRLVDVCVFSYVDYGDDHDIRNLLKEKPSQKGIICCQQVNLTFSLFYTPPHTDKVI